MAGERNFLPSAPIENIRLRAVLLRAVRSFFDVRGYLEVETPLISADATIDPNLASFVTRYAPAGQEKEEKGVRPLLCQAPAGPFRQKEPDPFFFFLQTSPEFAMKRLLAAGHTAIYQVTHAFRNGEIGKLHNPEFTIVEWYRVGDTYHQQMDVVEELVRHVFTIPMAEAGASGERAEGAVAETPRDSNGRRGGSLHPPTSHTWAANREGAESLPYASRAKPTSATGPKGIASSGERAKALTTNGPFGRLSYKEAFERHAGFDPLTIDLAEMPKIAASRGVVPPPGLGAEDRDGWLNFLLVELVEPNLGQDRPQFVYDYPASQAALARIRRDSPPVAERFELYVRGIELCNGYQELTDAEELRERIRERFPGSSSAAERLLSSRLLDAMDAGLPECSGVALGFDRLVMLAVGAESLAEVMPFPFSRA